MKYLAMTAPRGVKFDQYVPRWIESHFCKVYRRELDDRVVGVVDVVLVGPRK